MNQTFTLSTFEGVGDTRPKQITRTWDQLCAKFARPVVRQEKDGLLFSPAKYRAPRRLIANVIELSLLVLEVDGAWRCDDCGHQGPLVMFRNRRHEGDRCPACKKRDKKLECSNVSQIQFCIVDLAAACRRAYPSAFALYSTHGHKRQTETNPLAEPRFRIVIPLSEPVPRVDFLELWYAAVDSLKEVPADPQVKDPNRIYYTPVRFSEAAPYEYHIEPGEPLDWNKFLLSERFPAEQRANVAETGFGDGEPQGRGVSNTTASPSAVLGVDDIYSSHESRHEELCRRLVARGGRPNTRGNYDRRCLAHGGKGTTAVLYNPRSGAVACNRQCTYEELLRAEGLDDRKLPPRARVEAWQAATVKAPSRPADAAELPSGTSTAAPPSGNGAGWTPAVPANHLAATGDLQTPIISLAKLHVINALLLAHLFELSPEDETTVRRYWEPFAEEIEWPGTDDLRPIKVCSFPSRRLQLEAAKRLSEEFALEGVPGFYQPRLATEIPGPEGAMRKAELANYGQWRIALDQYRMRPGALLAPYDNGSGYICGIRIFRNVRDKCPFLLTSRALPGGAKAVGYLEASAA